MQLNLRKKRSSIIPVASMGDIAFLLLIFFMLSSIADAEKEIQVTLPESRVTVEEKGKFFNVYITKEQASGDYLFYYGFDKCTQDTIQLLTNFAQSKLLELDPAMIAEYKVLVRSDKDVPYNYVNSALSAIKEAGIHNVMLVSNKKLKRLQ